MRSVKCKMESLVKKQKVSDKSCPDFNLEEINHVAMHLAITNYPNSLN